MKESKLDHTNHPIDQQTYDNYVENMRLTNENEDSLRKMIAVGGNKKKIKMDLMNTTGKPIMMKQIHNLQTKMQNETARGTGNELQKLYDILVAIPGATVRFVTNDNGDFVGNFSTEKSFRFGNAIN